MRVIPIRETPSYIAANRLRRFIQPGKKSDKHKVAGTKSRLSKTNDVTEDVTYSETKSLQNLERYQKHYGDVDYDPEFDMSEARFQEAHKEISQSHFAHNPNPPFVHYSNPIQGLGIPIDSESFSQPISKERFTFVTFLEGIMVYLFLNKSFEKGLYRFRYSTHTVNTVKKQLDCRLYIFMQNKCLFKLNFRYKIDTATCDVTDMSDNTIMGHCNFDLLSSNFKCEKMSGKIFNNNFCINPIWDPKNPQRLRSQTIQIGSFNCDLTPPSTSYQKGTFRQLNKTTFIPFSITHRSVKSKKDVIMTKKKDFTLVV